MTRRDEGGGHPKASGYSTEHTMFALRHAQAGTSVPEVCGKLRSAEPGCRLFTR
jgi:hypothetical protein